MLATITLSDAHFLFDWKHGIWIGEAHGLAHKMAGTSREDGTIQPKGTDRFHQASIRSCPTLTSTRRNRKQIDRSHCCLWVCLGSCNDSPYEIDSSDIWGDRDDSRRPGSFVLRGDWPVSGGTPARGTRWIGNWSSSGQHARFRTNRRDPVAVNRFISVFGRSTSPGLRNSSSVLDALHGFCRTLWRLSFRGAFVSHCANSLSQQSL